MNKKKCFVVVLVLLGAFLSSNLIVKSKHNVNSLVEANIEALAESDSVPETGAGDKDPNKDKDKTVVAYICKICGCCGGSRNCMTPSVNIGGYLTAGITFYME